MATVIRPKLRIISWHINSLENIFDVKTFLDSFDADIICLQGTRITRDEVIPYADIEGYNAYFSFCRKRGEDSGVATFCRNSSKPTEAEEGLTGLLPSRGNDAGIGNYCQSRMSYPGKYYLRDIDSDGRALITSYIVQIEDDLEYIAIFNVYLPRVDPESPESELDKLDYHKILELRIYDLLDMGYFVVVAGDLNFAHRPIDHFDPGDIDLFLQDSARLWMNTVCNFQEMMQNYFDEENDSLTGIKLVDTFRLLYPFKENAYTYWSTTFARDNNYGARHDYFLVDNYLKPYVRESEILTHIKGSDHCPIKLILEVKMEQELVTMYPKLCSKFYPELFSKEYKLAEYSKANPRCPIQALQCHEINMNIDFTPCDKESTSPQPGTSGVEQQEKNVNGAVKKQAPTPYVPPFQELRVVSKTTGAVSYYRVAPPPAALATAASASSTYSPAPFNYTASTCTSAPFNYTAASTYTFNSMNYSSPYTSGHFSNAVSINTYPYAPLNCAAAHATLDDSLSDTCSSLNSTASSIDEKEIKSLNVLNNDTATPEETYHGQSSENPEPVVQLPNSEYELCKFGTTKSKPELQDLSEIMAISSDDENTPECVRFDGGSTNNNETLSSSVQNKFLETTFLPHSQNSETLSTCEKKQENVLPECDTYSTPEFEPGNKPIDSNTLLTEEAANNLQGKDFKPQDLNCLMSGMSICSEEHRSDTEIIQKSECLIQYSLHESEDKLISCQYTTSLLNSDNNDILMNDRPAVEIPEEGSLQECNSLSNATYSEERNLNLSTSSTCVHDFKNFEASFQYENNQKLACAFEKLEICDTVEEESCFSSPLAQDMSTDIAAEHVTTLSLTKKEKATTLSPVDVNRNPDSVNVTKPCQESSSLSSKSRHEAAFSKRKGRNSKGKSWRRMKGHPNEHGKPGEHLE